MTVDSNFKAVRPCVKCGASDRRNSGDCRPCAAILDAIRAGKPEIKEKRKKAYEENASAIKAKIAMQRLQNIDKFRAREAAYRAANPEKRKASATKWQKANPEARRLNNANRRAREQSAEGKLSRGLSVKLFKLQKGKCPCCKQPLGDDYHMDHVIPLALGGQNVDGNMQLLRAVCNVQKKAKHPIEFMQSRGFLL
jgi:5-methylcytosine-specific restriction endonuclease McrA